ncbi:MAG TPA: hypothetical protein DEP04_06515 [Dehalococcoidia bacterium]|nr:hypothetical protein [Dehalococcoidia bacterium]
MYLMSIGAPQFLQLTNVEEGSNSLGHSEQENTYFNAVTLSLVWQICDGDHHNNLTGGLTINMYSSASFDYGSFNSYF